MHVLTHLSPNYQAMLTPENGWYTEEAGMAQMDDEVGAVLQLAERHRARNNTIVVFTHRQRRRGVHLARWRT